MAKRKDRPKLGRQDRFGSLSVGQLFAHEDKPFRKVASNKACEVDGKGDSILHVFPDYCMVDLPPEDVDAEKEVAEHVEGGTREREGEVKGPMEGIDVPLGQWSPPTDSSPDRPPNPPYNPNEVA